ncbi:heterocyst frequency control protein PatD [Synechocystis sp. LEGE 06083]|uniref:heterocyst frequency control protein PatD n=1 Tax=Synechocystis sp. LEGE 06083 TaxID=915336 RepID=UPI001880DDBB|nr:heterocyst frequency control protein PatD [Synechocystis sp. LEGE 06083]MBE9196606.1 heterocyst frequency control protein PatD [Synechocystis sp. LEGE 06083]
MSSTLPSDLPDRLRELQQLLERCQLTMADPRAEEATVAKQVSELEDFLGHHLISVRAEELPTQGVQQWPSLQTEFRRTLRLLSTELLFWRSARSPERRHHYQQRLLGHYQQLMDFSRAMQQLIDGAD